MCGRFKRSVTWAEYFEYLSLTGAIPNAPPRYNIAPTDPVHAVRIGADGQSELATFRWGLIPAWAKDLAFGAKTINARADTLKEKPAFRDAFARRRCLILADGFYEWKIEGKIKQPYLIAPPDGRPFVFAGLWDRWHPPAPGGAGPIQSCTIVTTEANEELRVLHERMPVILPKRDHESWLRASAGATPDALLKPYAGELAVTRVSIRVNSVKNDDAGCIEPEQTLFSSLL
ncbi:MAG: SOS response-associated peptidase [Alphaproteobacteria bacterium]|nr:SOS response-associated peptidase [Alphaproteobacteria bacterium]